MSKLINFGLLLMTLIILHDSPLCSAASYKITYFSVTGMAEPIRFLLSYLKIDFVDYRFDQDQWPAIKPTVPFGKVPVLEIDGKVLNQTTAITRYLSRMAGLAGVDDWESMLIDIAVDNIHDLRLTLASFWYESNAESKKAKYEILISETIPFYMDKFDSIVGANGGFFINGKLTWADLFFVAISDYLNFMAGMDLLKGRKELEALKEKVLVIPQIKSWIEKRPKSVIKQSKL